MRGCEPVIVTNTCEKSIEVPDIVHNSPLRDPRLLHGFAFGKFPMRKEYIPVKRTIPKGAF